LALLAQKKVKYLNVGPDIIEYLKGNDPKTLYAPHIQHHFNEAGNKFLAWTVYRYLILKKLL